jgi:hypothetical protein
MSHICPGDCRQFRRSLCFWYLKTNILEMPITPTDAQQADLSTAKLGLKAGTKCVPQSHRQRLCGGCCSHGKTAYTVRDVPTRPVLRQFDMRVHLCLQVGELR